MVAVVSSSLRLLFDNQYVRLLRSPLSTSTVNESTRIGTG